MNLEASVLSPRAERYFSAKPGTIAVYADEVNRLGFLKNISRSGIGIVSDNDSTDLTSGLQINEISIVICDHSITCGPAYIARVTAITDNQTIPANFFGVAFQEDQNKLIEDISEFIHPYSYVNMKKIEIDPVIVKSDIDACDHTPADFVMKDSHDLFAKCNAWSHYTNDLKQKKLYQRLYRVTAISGLDSHVTMFDPVKRVERVFICFDSNSYLGLHLHPRVIERVTKVLKKVGYGTPSAQALCGTNRYLRELESSLSAFHNRAETMIFPSGFAANIGIITALIRHKDAIVRDRFAHASIHEGCRASKAKFNRIFAHNDPDSLEKMLRKAHEQKCRGKLVVTDGVFSMHGRIAKLPELFSVCQRYGAKMMVDDAHGTGVIGATGKGIEEHFNMEGAVDIIMGTLSKTFGGLGGYICGDSELISYLRYFAASGMFTTTPPAAMCAGVVEVLKLMQEEPQHRFQLWKNIRHFSPALKDAGFIVSEPVSPIITVFVGAHPLMWEISRSLFDAGIKCGNVMYPAVPKDESILRLTINARHTQEDIDYTVQTLTNIGRKFGILYKTEQEIAEIGRVWCASRAA